MSSELDEDNDSKINAILLLQRHLLHVQTRMFAKFAEGDDDANLQTRSPASSIPAVISRRSILDETHQNKRLVDDVELTILAILDSEGVISLTSRLEDFLVIMTRVTKVINFIAIIHPSRARQVDHRALCLHIVAEALSEDCAKFFVENGGLRLLKRWLRNAEEENCLAELRQIVFTCKKLPFDENVVRDSEIGKHIKRLLKFKSANHSDVVSLHAEVKSLMSAWMTHMQQLKEKAENKPPMVAETSNLEPLTNNLLKAISGRLRMHKHHDLPPSDVGEERRLHQGEGECEGDASSSEGKGGAEASMFVPSPSLSEFALPSEEDFDPQTSQLTTTVHTTQRFDLNGPSAVAVGKVAPSPSPSPRAAPRREKRSGVDMVESARKIIAAKEAAAVVGGQGLAMTGGHAAPSAPGKDRDGLSVRTSTLPPPPAKSALKKRGGPGNGGGAAVDGMGADGAPGPVAKRAVQWGDEVEGGALREVRTFEVERIRSSVVNYKNHKDLVKKEKQLEKDANAHKVLHYHFPISPQPRPFNNAWCL